MHRKNHRDKAANVKSTKKAEQKESEGKLLKNGFESKMFFLFFFVEAKRRRHADIVLQMGKVLFVYEWCDGHRVKEIDRIIL